MHFLICLAATAAGLVAAATSVGFGEDTLSRTRKYVVTPATRMATTAPTTLTGVSSRSHSRRLSLVIVLHSRAWSLVGAHSRSPARQGVAPRPDESRHRGRT